MPDFDRAKCNHSRGKCSQAVENMGITATLLGHNHVCSHAASVELPSLIHRADVRSHLFCGIGGQTLNAKSFNFQSKTTIVHNPHTYCCLLPNPIQFD